LRCSPRPVWPGSGKLTSKNAPLFDIMQRMPSFLHALPRDAALRPWTK
jgi:hypothetical protein